MGPHSYGLSFSWWLVSSKTETPLNLGAAGNPPGFQPGMTGCRIWGRTQAIWKALFIEVNQESKHLQDWELACRQNWKRLGVLPFPMIFFNYRPFEIMCIQRNVCCYFHKPCHLTVFQTCLFLEVAFEAWVIQGSFCSEQAMQDQGNQWCLVAYHDSDSLINAIYNWDFTCRIRKWPVLWCGTWGCRERGML